MPAVIAQVVGDQRGPPETPTDEAVYNQLYSKLNAHCFHKLFKTTDADRKDDPTLITFSSDQ